MHIDEMKRAVGARSICGIQHWPFHLMDLLHYRADRVRSHLIAGRGPAPIAIICVPMIWESGKDYQIAFLIIARPRVSESLLLHTPGWA